MNAISTHTSLAGRDKISFRLIETFFIFLLTRPSRDVTDTQPSISAQASISTHTSLAGRDSTRPITQETALVFLLTRPSRDVTAIFSTL